MMVRAAAALLAVFVVGAVLGASAQVATATAPRCAQTLPASPLSPAPGSPCWTDVTPYPFGFDGNPVDENSAACQAWERQTNRQYQGGYDPIVCYLSVDSMAFRSWNRGVAVVSPPLNSDLSTTAFGVWLYNGTRWFADPTFPGQSVCKGSTVLWAGKLDYWLVGQIGAGQGAVEKWPALCRFDGVNFSWEPLAVPASALADVPLDPTTGKPAAGAIQAGACLSWDNCWFFGSYGVVLHWDGQSLSNATPGLGASPWLMSDFTAAAAGTDAAGNPFALALAGTSGGANANGATLGQATPSDPDGAPPHELYRSGGGPFQPVDYSPPTTGLPSDPYQTDLAAVGFNSQGQGWLAGDPRGLRPGITPAGGPTQPEPSPLVPVSTSGAVQPCAATAPDAFTYSAGGPSGYLWRTIGVLPNGDAVAGGSLHDPSEEPLLAQVSCDKPPRLLRFGSTDPSTGDFMDVDPNGAITAVAANAINDAWASATAFGKSSPLEPQPPPHLYRLTDTQKPLAPPGNDVEPRPLVVQSEATIFVFAPKVVVTPRPPKQVKIKKRKGKTVHVPPPIYAVQPPKLVRGPGGTFSLVITFKVRSKVTIGLEAFRRGKLVSSSGLKTFRGRSGELVLRLDPHRWPTKLKFVTPKTSSKK
jgi:hypothetical protein